MRKKKPSKIQILADRLAELGHQANITTYRRNVRGKTGAWRWSMDSIKTDGSRLRVYGSDYSLTALLEARSIKLLDNAGVAGARGLSDYYTLIPWNRL